MLKRIGQNKMIQRVCDCGCGRVLPSSPPFTLKWFKEGYTTTVLWDLCDQSIADIIEKFGKGREVTATVNIKVHKNKGMEN